MPKTIRKVLLEKCDQAQNCLDRMDLYLMDMELIAKGRQPAIIQIKRNLLLGHDHLRILWTLLKSQL